MVTRTKLLNWNSRAKRSSSHKDFFFLGGLRCMSWVWETDEKARVLCSFLGEGVLGSSSLHKLGVGK